MTEQKKIKFYILERVEAHKQGRRTEYHRLVERAYFTNKHEALLYAQQVYGANASVQAANPGYEEGR